MTPLPVLAASLLAAAPLPDLSPRRLWEAWPARRAVALAAPCLRHAGLVEAVRALERRHAERLAVESVGRSVEGRPLLLLKLGRGPRHVLLWSQMHGDEPSATPALVDVVDTLLSADVPAASAVLDRLTLLVLPMLNPDGAERYERRNAQGIDINRDALPLATPEGRALKAVRDRFEPELGFNLHDQDRRTTVADSGVLSTISLLAVAGDAAGTLTPGRARAKRVCSAIVRALSPFAPGGIARYDEDWNPRAFGDNLTAWGTPIVLIESGGLPPGRSLSELSRFNYVALLTVLEGLARDDLAGEDAALYEGLKRNQERLFVDVLLSGGRVAQQSAAEPYRADVAFDVLDDDPAAAGCPGAFRGGPSRLRELGDSRLLAAARRVDATGRVIVPSFVASVRGLGAREWLDGPTLDVLARLGVGRVRWHVAPPGRAAAVEAAARLVAPGRAAIEVVDADAAAAALVVSRRPSPPTSSSLAAALAAATSNDWRPPGDGQTLSQLLPSLQGGAAGAAPLLAPEARASLVVLRLGQEGSLDPSRLEIERVFLDGREVERGR